MWPTRNLLALKIFSEINSLLVTYVCCSKNVDSTKVFAKRCESKFRTFYSACLFHIFFSSASRVRIKLCSQNIIKGTGWNFSSLRKIIVLHFPAKCNNYGTPLKSLHNSMKLAHNMEKNKLHWNPFQFLLAILWMLGFHLIYFWREK